MVSSVYIETNSIVIGRRFITRSRCGRQSCYCSRRAERFLHILRYPSTATYSLVTDHFSPPGYADPPVGCLCADSLVSFGGWRPSQSAALLSMEHITRFTKRTKDLDSKSLSFVIRCSVILLSRVAWLLRSGFHRSPLVFSRLGLSRCSKGNLHVPPT